MLHSETESTCNALLNSPSQSMKRKQTTEEINVFLDKWSAEFILVLLGWFFIQVTAV